MDIIQPVIHDRHVVKKAFELLKSQTEPNVFNHPKDLTIVACRNKGTMEDRIIPHLSGYEDTSILEDNLKYLGIDCLGEIHLSLKCYTTILIRVNVLLNILCVVMLSMLYL